MTADTVQKALKIEECTRLLAEEPEKSRAMQSLHLSITMSLSRRLHQEEYTFDYGNAFMKSIYDAGVKK